MLIHKFIKLKKNYNTIIEKNPNVIVMFSEGNTYKNTNYPVLDKLAKQVEVVYLTLDKNDELLKNKRDNIHAFLVDFGVLGSHFLKTLKAKLVIMTTPGLGALALKKSKNVKHYSHFMHAPTDVHRYGKFAFDCFDSVVCAGDFNIKTIEHLEKARNFPKKEKIALGVAYYDVMKKEYDKCSVVSDNKTVLIAPSWGNSNFINYYKNDIVGEFISKGYNVILRPHPQSYKHEPSLINSIVSKYGNNAKFSLDKNISNIESMKASSLLVSGYSGMIFDYIFFTEKPCLLFDMAGSVAGFEEEDIDFPSWESLLMPKIGKLVSLDDDINIDEVLNYIENNYSDITANIKKAKSEIANFACASKPIAQFFIDKINKSVK